MIKTDMLSDSVEDEEIIELTDEIESEDEEIIDLTDGIDPIPQETVAPVASSIEIPSAAGSAPPEIGEYMKANESGKSLSIEELTIDSLDEEIPALDIDTLPAQPSAADRALDIDLDLDRLLPETFPSLPSSMDAPAAVFEPVHEPSPISLDALLAEEPTDLSSEPLLDIGLPLSSEPPAEGGASVPPDGMRSTDIVPAPYGTDATPDMADRISDEQIDRAVERVIREMFEERISAAIYEVVERVVQDEMDRLRRLLLEEK
uniref:DUF2497 domain-containing protein n=1 Tax=Desulfatirhabdium butyrativorans TaxID=340467 RepID=A0A7C4RRC7_9BACT